MPSSLEDLLASVAGLRSEVAGLVGEYEGRAMPDEVHADMNAKADEIRSQNALIKDLQARHALLDELAGDPTNVENERSAPQIQARRPGSAAGINIWDLSTVRNTLAGHDVGELRERTMRALEISGIDAANQENIRSLVEDTSPEYGSNVAKHILITGSPAYRSAFRKRLAGEALTSDEIRAMSLTGAAGGFATIPYQLDPTIIKTGALAINPLREISRNVQIAGTNVWKGVSSGAVVASYDTEGSAVSDDSPTYAQPSITCHPARAFVPYTFELGEDYPGLLNDLGGLMAEAKLTLEANKMVLGTGTGEPFGIITRATTTVATASVATFARGDLDLLDNALPARYQQNASIIGNRVILNRVPAMDTTNGNTLFGPGAQLSQPRGTSTRMRYDILGLPTYQVSDMVSTTTTGSKIMVEGDFNQYVIVDRIGAMVEQIQNLFDPTTALPTGKRGLLLHWRSGADVTNAAAFRTLVVA
jgi:HK97 family phage major capsid protein